MPDSQAGRSATMASVESHLDAILSCTECPRMHRPPVVGRPVVSRILLVGQAPGVKEPVLGKPFAWTAGKTLFKWIQSATGWEEEEARVRIYFAAVCRCFPGKNPKGGDRVPDPLEIRNCAKWLEHEVKLLRPSILLPVGKLAISQFLEFSALADVVGRAFPVTCSGHRCEVIPLPHPSGASTWHRTEPGRTLLGDALRILGDRISRGGWRSVTLRSSA
ncbi:MAG: uracil-DNA glycosylase family protein [Terrimicrobiaceae bacterium]